MGYLHADPARPSNVQSIVLRSHPCAHSRHFLFRIKDKRGAKAFLAGWLPRVTHGGIMIDPRNPPCPIVNITLSWSGLNNVGAFDALGGITEAEKAFYFDFKDPPDATSLRAYGPAHRRIGGTSALRPVTSI